MSDKIHALIIEDQEHIREIVHFSVASYFGFLVTSVNSAEEALKIMRSGQKVDILICDYSIGEGHAVRVYAALREVNSKVPFILTSGKDRSLYPDFAQFKDVVGVDKEGVIDQLNAVIESYFQKVDDNTRSDYVDVPISTLIRFKGLSEDIYIRLRTGRYLRLFRQGDQILTSDVERFKRKGVHILYIHKVAANYILKNVQVQITNFVAGKKVDFQLNVSLKESADSPRGPTGKEAVPFVINVSKDSEPELGPPKVKINIGGDKEGEDEGESVKSPFNFEQDFINSIEAKLKGTKKMVKKNPPIQKLLKKLKVNREKSKYIVSRTNLMCNITCGIARVLEWGTDGTLDKLIYCSYMHDVALFENPDLARIFDMMEWKKVEKKFTAEQQKKFLNHPKEVADIIRSHAESPPEADVICAQHHERPDGTGFPNKVPGPRIIPLSALFIISLDFAQYILDDSKWTFKEFYRLRKPIYRSGNFSKVMVALGKLEKFL